MAPPPDFTMARTRSRFPPPRAATRSPATSLVARAESRDRELTPQSHLQLHPAGSLARTDSWWAFSCFELGMWCILFIWFTAFRWENTGISVKVRCKREVLRIKIWKTLFPFNLRHIDCKKVCNEL